MARLIAQYQNMIIGPLSAKDRPESLMEYINALVNENTFILINRKVTLKEEKEYISRKLRAIRKRDSICLVVEHNKRIVGILNADREPYKMRNNVVLGIALLAEYRGKGLGEFAMRILIKQAKEKLKPKNIYLRVFAINKRAIRLYTKLGFKKLAVLPDWAFHRDKYTDEYIMLLKNQ